MWITYFNWFLAILSLIIWVGTYLVWGREKFLPWFDNKFGKDDPMPPVPKQQDNIGSTGDNQLNVGEGSTFNYKIKPKSDQPEE